MTTTETPGPTIRNAAVKAANPRKLFLNLPVADLQRSIEFFEALGFSFNLQFTDATATSMLVGEDAYVMLLTRDKFAEFSKRPVGDARKVTNAMIAFAVHSRGEVDAIVNTAIAAGGARVQDAVDHGFMYQSAFYDLDGHHWEVFWMDPAFVNG